jgi:hypothetical protein
MKGYRAECHGAQTKPPMSLKNLNIYFIGYRVENQEDGIYSYQG